MSDTESQDTSWETEEVETHILNDENLLGEALGARNPEELESVIRPLLRAHLYVNIDDWSLVDWDEVYRTINDT